MTIDKITKEELLENMSGIALSDDELERVVGGMDNECLRNCMRDLPLRTFECLERCY